MAIPQRIIQTAKSLDLAPMAKASVANLTALNPGWEHLLFDDGQARRFISEELPEYLSTFDSFPFKIQQVDFFRYLAVYRLGGFYFDLDFLLYRSLSPLLDCACVFPFERLTLSDFLRRQRSIDWELGNYAFGAAAGDPFLKAVIDNCVRAQADPEWVQLMMTGIPTCFSAEFKVLHTTGPGLVTRTFAENKAAREGVTVLLPADVCSEKNWNGFGDYGIHLMDGSWRPKGSAVHRVALRWWKAKVSRRQLTESRALGPRRFVSLDA